MAAAGYRCVAARSSPVIRLRRGGGRTRLVFARRPFPGDSANSSLAPGTGTASSRPLAPARPLSRCSRRCSTTAPKTACTCSGITVLRPQIIAQARAARSNPIAARGDSPARRPAALRVCDMDTENGLLQALNRLHAQDAAERVHQFAPIRAAQQFPLGGGGRITQMHAHQETVELRFRQREGTDL